MKKALQWCVIGGKRDKSKALNATAAISWMFDNHNTIEIMPICP
jgi:hypothetical protein|tara:strand:+ start:8110 stop:8241 length:132 start_codon:yes stop_codon:yes gene_type:complete